jgi:hypothetical protein
MAVRRASSSAVPEGEQFLVAVFEVQREFVGDFSFARWGEFEWRKAVGNLRLPFRHFLPL